jgi:predicted ester cyclase
MIGREAIERALRALNAAENSLPRATVDAVISAIDQTMSRDVQGWMNGEHRPNREAERTIERLLFTDLPDYHRSIERLIIDPPFAAIAWKMSGTSRSLDRPVEVSGCSQFQFDDDGQIARYWIYVDQSWLRG